MKLTVAGSAALDTIRTPKALRKDVLGGSAVYASLCASFFCPTSIMSVVGDDFPSRYMKAFKDRRVDVSFLEIVKGKTFRWEACYDDLGMGNARTLRTELNVFAGHEPRILRSSGAKGGLLLANIAPDLQNYILDRFSPSGITACDTMNIWIDTARKELLKLLKKVDVFFLNDSEARQLSGEHDLLKAGKYILKKGPGAVVIKKAENGVLCFSNGSLFAAPAYPVEKVVDTTGAGDSFAGGTMGYLCHTKKTWEEALRMALIHGTIMASFAVERFSAASLVKVDKQKIKDRYSTIRHMTDV